MNREWKLQSEGLDTNSLINKFVEKKMKKAFVVLEIFGHTPGVKAKKTNQNSHVTLNSGRQINDVQLDVKKVLRDLNT